MNTEFSTKDLHLAAYLKLKEAQLLRLEKPEATNFKSPSFFVFLDHTKCKALEQKFWEEGDSVNIKEYIAVIRDLRSRVSAIPYGKREN